MTYFDHSVRNRRRAAFNLAAAGLVLLLGPVAATAAKGGEPAVRHYDNYPNPSSGPGEYVLAAKWDQAVVTYSFSNCPSHMECGAALEIVRAAAEEWDSVCGLTLTEVTTDGDITIGWYSGNHGDGEPFDGPGGVLAHAFFPKSFLGSLAGDLHFDDDEGWVQGAGTAALDVDLKTTALHELGHSLGLDHSSDPGALMWIEYVGVRDIAADDVAGIQALYGTPSPDEAQGAPNLSPTGITATAAVTAKVRVGPDTSAPEIGKVNVGSIVNVFGRNVNSDWIYIEYAGLQGWSAGWLFELNGDINALPVIDQNAGGAAPPPAEPTQSPSDGSVTGIAVDTVRMRLGPDTSYPEIGKIPRGSTVVVLARNDGYNWVVVEYTGVQGWAAAWLFTFSGSLKDLPVQ